MRSIVLRLELLLVLALVVLSISGKKRVKGISDKTQLPIGIWAGIEDSDINYMVSFCENNSFFRSKRITEHIENVRFGMSKDEFGLEISIENAKTGKWVGLTLLYIKAKNQLFFWGDNGESELTMADTIPMKQISTKCNEQK